MWLPKWRHQSKWCDNPNNNVTTQVTTLEDLMMTQKMAHEDLLTTKLQAVDDILMTLHEDTDNLLDDTDDLW